MKNDLTICKKIQETRLFSDTRKIELLVRLSDSSEAEKQALEEGIDAFDAEYKAAVEKHTQQIQSLLGHVLKDMTPEERKKSQDALDEINFGLALLHT